MCGAFVRSLVSPHAALLFIADADPGDWPTSSASRIADSQLGHALGWVCEVRANDVVLLDPLGEGVLRADLPSLSDAWKNQVRATNSAAVFLVPSADVDVEATQAGSPEWVSAVLEGHIGPIRAATVRTSVSDQLGAPPKLGRNDPCHCGSGKKLKNCHRR